MQTLRSCIRYTTFGRYTTSGLLYNSLVSLCNFGSAMLFLSRYIISVPLYNFGLGHIYLVRLVDRLAMIGGSGLHLGFREIACVCV